MEAPPTAPVRMSPRSAAAGSNAATASVDHRRQPHRSRVGGRTARCRGGPARAGPLTRRSRRRDSAAMIPAARPTSVAVPSSSASAKPWMDVSGRPQLVGDREQELTLGSLRRGQGLGHGVDGGAEIAQLRVACRVRRRRGPTDRRPRCGPSPPPRSAGGAPCGGPRRSAMTTATMQDAGRRDQQPRQGGGQSPTAPAGRGRRPPGCRGAWPRRGRRRESGAAAKIRLWWIPETVPPAARPAHVEVPAPSPSAAPGPCRSRRAAGSSRPGRWSPAPTRPGRAGRLRMARTRRSRTPGRRRCRPSPRRAPPTARSIASRADLAAGLLPGGVDGQRQRHRPRRRRGSRR